MIKQQYIPLALRTLSTVEPFLLTKDQWDIAHAIMGIASEVGELAGAIQAGDEINVAEEIGDILWFSAILETKTGYPIDIIESKDVQFEDPEDNTRNLLRMAYPVANLIITSGDLLSLLKKGLFYRGNGEIGGEAKQLMKELGREIGQMISWMSFDETTIRSKNIAKLKVRYPDKFNTDSAINRDLDKERDTLS